jgi:hypothetical protein
MSKAFGVTCAAIVVLVLLGCLGLFAPIQLVFFLVFGWVPYLQRVLPQVRIDRAALATAIVCLALLVGGLHRFASWLYGDMQSPTESGHDNNRRWPLRWTLALVSSVVLMFIAGIAAVGMTHQTGWLLFSRERMVGNSFSALMGRVHSLNNLKQIGLGLLEYQEKHQTLPPACAIDGVGRPQHGWMAAILPFVKEQELFDRIDFSVPWDDPSNAPAYRTVVTSFSNFQVDRVKNADGYALSYYAGNALVLSGTIPRRTRDFADGAGNTILAGEVITRLKPWGDPINWRDPTLGLNRDPGGFGGRAPGGVTFLMADGSARFIKDSINPRVLAAISTPDGGERIEPSDDY